MTLPSDNRFLNAEEPAIRAVDPTSIIRPCRRLRAWFAWAVVVALCSLNTSIHAAPDADQRAGELLARMSLEEKIGQMTQVDSSALKDRADIQRFFIGSVLSGGGSDPAGGDNSPQGWLNLAEDCKAWALKTRLKIPLIYGIDAVHGHNNVLGAVIFPHNIGLGATRNPDLVKQAARVTAEEMLGTDIHWTFAPCVAVAQDDRWGRTYESFSSSPELVSLLGAAAVTGFQGPQLSANSPVLACAKHFLGDGGTFNGVDQGDTRCDEATLRRLHLPPYAAAVKAGVGSVMVSYSSWNGQKMHGQKYWITDVLKGELGFQGFVVSDWAAIDQLPGDYKSDIETSINAGLDMIMIPHGPGRKNNYVEFIQFLRELVDEGRVSPARIDDAVRRILRVKYAMGAFETKPVDPALTAAIGSAAHRQVARECVRQSLVLLKNDRAALPLSKDLKHLCVVGDAADDLGLQCGGWTIAWQGKSGNVTPGGTTLLQAIRQTVSSNTVVSFSADGSGLEGADAIIVAVAERPYAETEGDREDLRLPPGAGVLIRKARLAGAPVVTVLFSGRAMILGEALADSDAFVAAWLPGTEGQGLADVLFGDFKPTGKLPRPWPRTMEGAGVGEVLFPFGHGLTYGSRASGASTRASTTADE